MSKTLWFAWVDFSDVVCVQSLEALKTTEKFYVFQRGSQPTKWRKNVPKADCFETREQALLALQKRLLVGAKAIARQQKENAELQAQCAARLLDGKGPMS
jgi:hypothetical protein